METHQRNPKKRDRDEEEDNGFPRKEDFPPPPPAAAAAGDRNLKVKLRIDKNPRAGESPEKKDHVCVECNKRFSSGKALGGHMSSAHVQANRDYSYRKKKQVVRGGTSGKGSDEDGGGTEEEESEEGRREYYRDKDGQIRCPHCCKKFPSRKSLFGHMRCHPDRYWRGMEPPPLHHQTLTISDHQTLAISDHHNTYKSSSSEEEEDEKDEKEISPEGVIDLQGYLSTWASTAKRGRSPINRRISSTSSGDDSDEELQEAVHHLVCLGNAQNPNPEINPGFMGKGKERLSDNEDDDSEELTKWINPKNIDCPNENASVPAPSNNNNNKKRRILLMESEAESPKEASSDDYSDQNIKLFKCSTCNKSFSSHQALGGHRSSHNKFKLSVQNTIDDWTNASASSAPLQNPQSYPQTVANPHENNNNDASNASSKYQCSVCNKVFATGKALGGHKKCHSTPQLIQPALPNSPERSSTPRNNTIDDEDEDDDEPKHLDFDLNEIPNDG
ncbi:PREDICTED: uncharacterized protein LOC109192806 [Ipomoea nil]|uniref:uncharacterized protein LOC109192806 n=1 Tax=Ipomoea nil TaxID=35883 RepID=UPI00090124AF|nr:PREDICTED: uncharacterized protein LOC109192806 [Ipomoea nil]